MKILNKTDQVLKLELHAGDSDDPDFGRISIMPNHWYDLGDHWEQITLFPDNPKTKEVDNG